MFCWQHAYTFLRQIFSVLKQAPSLCVCIHVHYVLYCSIFLSVFLSCLYAEDTMEDLNEGSHLTYQDTLDLIVESDDYAVPIKNASFAEYT